MELFKENKYSKWYFELTESRKNRTIETGVYYEKHHIIPKSLGGSNKKQNLVSLTAKEHFIAHLLLSEMCISKNHERKMGFALQKMMNNPSSTIFHTASQFELARIKNHKALLGRKFTEEHKLKLSISNTGVKRSEETKKRNSELAKLRTNELNPFYGRKHSKETKEQMSKTKKGVKKWITNGVDSLFVKKDDVLEDGWWHGRTKSY
jgi:hypothetical protein